MTDIRVTCVAIVGIAAVECVALLTGHNGVVLALVVAALAGLGGYEIRAAYHP